MSKFTKGKWKINKHFDIFSEDGQFIALCCVKHKEAYFSSKYKEIYTQETKANARLIAAAPEMYCLLDIAVSTLLHGNTELQFSVANKIKALLACIDGEGVNNDK